MRQLTRMILKIVGGAVQPDTLHAVTIRTDAITPIIVAVATETPALSGQYTASWTEQDAYGYWYVDGTKTDTWGRIWLGSVVGDVNYIDIFNINGTLRVTGSIDVTTNVRTPKLQMTSGAVAGYVLASGDDTGVAKWVSANLSGITNHASLVNLDYASAAHTDFAGTSVLNDFLAPQHFQSGIQVTGSLVGSTTIDARTGLLLNGQNINTSGVLSNVAYRTRDNQFQAGQVVTGSVLIMNNLSSDGNRLYFEESGGTTWAQNNANGTYRLFKGEGHSPVLASDGAHISILKDIQYDTYNAGLDVGTNVFVTGSIRLTDSISSPVYSSQTTGWRMTVGGALDCRYIYVDEMHARSFIADLEQALAGGQIVCKSVAPLSQVFTVPLLGDPASLYVDSFKGYDGFHVFVNGDTVRLRQFTRTGTQLDITDTWGTVTFVSEDTTTHTQCYELTKTGGSSTQGTTIGIGTLALDYGVTGNGYTEQNSIDGQMAENSPYFQVVKWTGAVYPSTLTTEARLGNLHGIIDSDFQATALPGFGFYTQNAFLKGNLVVKSLNSIPLQNSTVMLGNITGAAQNALKLANTGTAATTGLFYYDNASAERLALRGDNTAQIAGWSFDASKLYNGTDIVLDGTAKKVSVYSDAVKMYYTSAADYGITATGFHLGSTNTIAGWAFNNTRIYDTVTGYGLVLDSSAQFISVANNAVQMYYTGPTDYGIVASGFQLGSTNVIAGWTFTTDTLSKYTGAGATQRGISFTTDDGLTNHNPLITISRSPAGSDYITLGGSQYVGSWLDDTWGMNVRFNSQNLFSCYMNSSAELTAQIAGWTFSGTTLSKGGVALNSSVEKIIAGNSGSDSSGVGIRAVLGKYDGTNFGLRCWDGTKTYFELSSDSSQNKISSWKITDTLLWNTSIAQSYYQLLGLEGSTGRIRFTYSATSPSSFTTGNAILSLGMVHNGTGTYKIQLNSSTNSNEEFIVGDSYSAPSNYSFMQRDSIGFVNNASTGGSVKLKLGAAYEGGQIEIDGTKVLDNRQPGWSPATGNAERTAFDTESVAFITLARHVKAIQDDLMAHGLIGT